MHVKRTCVCQIFLLVWIGLLCELLEEEGVKEVKLHDTFRIQVLLDPPAGCKHDELLADS